MDYRAHSLIQDLVMRGPEEASTELTEVIRKPNPDSKVVWDNVELLMLGTQLIVWSRDDETSFPNLNTESERYVFLPEGCVTKQFWKKRFGAIEQWRRESKLL